MNAYLTQRVRDKHGIDWNEEYLLGLVNHLNTVKVMNILAVAFEVMTHATTHKYLSQLIEKGYLMHTVGDDKRVKVVTLTKKGEKLIKELADVSSLPSLVLR